MSTEVFAPKKPVSKKLKAFLLTAAVALVLFVFLMPLFYGLSISVKSPDQASSTEFNVLPVSPAQAHVGDQDLDLYRVPQGDGSTKTLALQEKTRAQATFVDPADPGAAPYVWKGNWRTLKTVDQVQPHWENFAEAWKTIDFLNLLKNTFLYAFFNTIGTLLSCSFVAYGFARFRFRGKNFAFMLVMATMILPSAVTTIPTYAFYYSIGWVGTWLPLIVPSFFANAFNIFLLRQFIMGIPRELDEAAKIDGAGPIRTLYQVILPQAVPALVAVALFNFFYCWNDYFAPLVYLAGKQDQYPISVGLSLFSTQYSTLSHLVQAASVMASVIPIIIFFFTRRFFMQGVVMTGVDK